MYKIFLDTNIYCANCYDFENSYFLYLLKCKSEGRIEFYINKIVEKEVVKHIQKDYDDFELLYKKFKKNIRLPKYSVPNIYEDNVITKNKEFVKKIFYDYLKKIKAIYLSEDKVRPSDIFNDYFESKSPFENKKDKKSEFPDAFIVKSINIENENDDFIFVSNDDGTRAAFNGSDNMKFKSIGDLYNFLTKEENENEMIEKFEGYCKANTDEVMGWMQAEISYSDVDFDGCNYDRDGIITGHDYYDYDISEVDIKEIYMDDIGTEKKGDIEYVAYATARVEILMHCTERNEDESYWDSEEKDYIIEKFNTYDEIHEANVDYFIYFKHNNDKIEITKCKVANKIELNQYTRKKILPCEEDNLDEELNESL